jgi:hypothetical protein
MKLILILLITAAALTSTLGQITTTKVATKTAKINNSTYDSLENFLGKNVQQYIGQELYLPGKAETLREYGYEDFLTDYREKKPLDPKPVYKCCDSYNSKYDSLNGKYFKVLDAIYDPQLEEDESLFGPKYFIKLQEKESKDTVYFKYNSSSQYSFPFVVVGFYKKAKSKYIGTKYILRGRNWVESNSEMYDIQTGKPVNISPSTTWKCVDFTIEEKYYELSLILENSNNERLAYSLDNLLKGTYFVFPKNKADKYKEKFGAENWNLIIAGKVKVGMTKEMCELSWGQPKKINQTITQGKKNEQYVYKENYLYFNNGLLTAIQ